MYSLISEAFLIACFSEAARIMGVGENITDFGSGKGGVGNMFFCKCKNCPMKLLCMLSGEEFCE